MNFNFEVKTIIIVANLCFSSLLKQFLYQFVCFCRNIIPGQDELLRTEC